MANVYLTIDSFEGVSNQLKVEIELVGGNLSGDWTTKINEIVGFPESGTYLTSLQGTLFSTEEEKIAELLSFSPEKTKEGDGHVLIKSGNINGGTALWHKLKESPDE